MNDAHLMLFFFSGYDLWIIFNTSLLMPYDDPCRSVTVLLDTLLQNHKVAITHGYRPSHKLGSKKRSLALISARCAKVSFFSEKTGGIRSKLCISSSVRVSSTA